MILNKVRFFCICCLVFVYLNCFVFIYEWEKRKTYIQVRVRTLMATKSITITDDAYERLVSFKEPNESFSDVVKKLTKRNSILKLAGLLSTEEATSMKGHIYKIRKKADLRMNEIAKKLK